MTNGTADFSACGTWRYTLSRYALFSTLAFHEPKSVLFIMLNPSMADAKTDDPTIRRCIGFAMREGYDQLNVVNLFALVATKPLDLVEHDDPVGSRNDRMIRLFAEECQSIVVAWGTRPTPWGPRNPEGGYKERVNRVLEILGPWRDRIFCLGRTLDGSPCHPLYLPKDRELEPFEW